MIFLSSSSRNVLCQDHVQHTCLSKGLPQRHIARDNGTSLLPQTQTGSETLVQQPPDFLIYCIKIWRHHGALQCKSQLGRLEGFAQAYYITTNVYPSPWSVSRSIQDNFPLWGTHKAQQGTSFSLRFAS